MTRSPIKPITLPEFRPQCSDVDDGRVAAQECTGSEWLVSAMEPELQKDTFFCICRTTQVKQHQLIGRVLLKILDMLAEEELNLN